MDVIERSDEEAVEYSRQCAIYLAEIRDTSSAYFPSCDIVAAVANAWMEDESEGVARKRQKSVHGSVGRCQSTYTSANGPTRSLLLIAGDTL